MKSVRVDTFSSILRQEQAFFDRSNTGDLISRLTADCGEMAGKERICCSELLSLYLINHTSATSQAI